MITMAVPIGVTEDIVTKCLTSGSPDFRGQSPQHTHFSETFDPFLSS